MFLGGSSADALGTWVKELQAQPVLGRPSFSRGEGSEGVGPQVEGKVKEAAAGLVCFGNCKWFGMAGV